MWSANARPPPDLGAFRQLAWNCREIDGNERRVGVARLPVDESGEQSVKYTGIPLAKFRKLMEEKMALLHMDPAVAARAWAVRGRVPD